MQRSETASFSPEAGCLTCGRVGCHCDLHRGVQRPTPQGCYTCGRVGCHSFWHWDDQRIPGLTSRSQWSATPVTAKQSASGKRDAGPEAGRSVPFNFRNLQPSKLQQPIVPLRFSVVEMPHHSGSNNLIILPSHILYFSWKMGVLSMLPLLTASVISPRILVNMEEQEVIVLLDT